MELVYITLILSLLLGLIGTWLRIIIQWRRDGVLPGGQSWEFGLLTESFIGLVSGLIMWLVYFITEPTITNWLIPILYLGCLAMGVAGTDSLENILKKYLPDG